MYEIWYRLVITGRDLKDNDNNHNHNTDNENKDNNNDENYAREPEQDSVSVKTEQIKEGFSKTHSVHFLAKLN